MGAGGGAVFLGLVVAAIDGLAAAGLVDSPTGDLTARIFLAAAEAGPAVGAALEPEAERQQAGALLMRFVNGLRTVGSEQTMTEGRT